MFSETTLKILFGILFGLGLVWNVLLLRFWKVVSEEMPQRWGAYCGKRRKPSLIKSFQLIYVVAKSKTGRVSKSAAVLLGIFVLYCVLFVGLVGGVTLLK